MTEAQLKFLEALDCVPKQQGGWFLGDVEAKLGLPELGGQMLLESLVKKGILRLVGIGDQFDRS